MENIRIASTLCVDPVIEESFERIGHQELSSADLTCGAQLYVKTG